jgi:HD-GYP domain-containing protein (c-di-GMP phosphodiesterase class II)
MRSELTINLGNLLLSLSEVPDLANPTIHQHQHRTAFISFEIAKNITANPETIENVFLAALLHDIGAVTVEEKISVHRFETLNETIHAARGEVLLAKIPWLKKISEIVRNHHKSWQQWEKPIDDPIVVASQIVLLSDYVERLIDRNKYILYQSKDIIEIIKRLEGTIVNKRIVDCFVEISKREEFWLDLVSPRLYNFLLRQGPFKNIQIDLDDIMMVSNLYRDLIDFKSRFTATHTAGVAECAVKMAELFGMAGKDIISMRIAGNFHDIGKLVIPNSILEKPGRLTADEFAIIRCHSYYTYHTINSIGGLQRIAEWAGFHHEKLDGSGYPFHCKPEEIGTGSRIVAVADIFTAISEDRPYRKGMNKNEVYDIIKSQVDDNKIDGKMTEILFDNYDDIYTLVKEQQSVAKDFYENRIVSIADKVAI